MYSRLLLKISGEALSGAAKHGIDTEAVRVLAHELRDAMESLSGGLVLVIGGGNIFRGSEHVAEGIPQAVADHMGMLATVMNGLALREVFTTEGLHVRLMSSFPLPSVCEMYTRDQALRHLRKKRIVICAGGTGNPFFTTDTTAALRALELDCNVICKATKVDGVYDKDPVKHPDAKKFDTLTYTTALSENLKVMDAAALSLCREHNIPIVVFNLFQSGNLRKAIAGTPVGTTITA